MCFVDNGVDNYKKIASRTRKSYRTCFVTFSSALPKKQFFPGAFYIEYSIQSSCLSIFSGEFVCKIYYQLKPYGEWQNRILCSGVEGYRGWLLQVGRDGFRTLKKRKIKNHYLKSIYFSLNLYEYSLVSMLFG